jgi:hypothetical protein
MYVVCENISSSFFPFAKLYNNSLTKERRGISFKLTKTNQLNLNQQKGTNDHNKYNASDQSYHREEILPRP